MRRERRERRRLTGFVTIAVLAMTRIASFTAILDDRASSPRRRIDRPADTLS